MRWWVGTRLPLALLVTCVLVAAAAALVIGGAITIVNRTALTGGVNGPILGARVSSHFVFVADLRRLRWSSRS
jgi:hypothetical protein